MPCTPVRRAAGSLGRPCAATTRRRISAWRAPRPGLAVWSAWAARLAASCRAPVAGGPRDRPRGFPRGGRARVVVVARPVVRHTRPTAACRPAASGPSVSRSSSCACSPCGDPLDIGRVTYIWIVTYVTYVWIVTSVWRVASRLGESVAEGIRLPRGDRALRDPPASRARASVPASRASGRRTVAARVSLGGDWSPAPRRRRGWRRAPAPLEQPLYRRADHAL